MSINNYHIRKAELTDADCIMQMIDNSRAVMRSNNNFNQWTDGYPQNDIILKDIHSSNGYIVTKNNIPKAYFAFIHSPEPTYQKIYGGQWLNDNPYYVIHRLAKAPDVKGILKAVLDYCFIKTYNIRIDTHRDNKIIQNFVIKYGFSYCGIIYLANGDERFAYQKFR